MPSIEWQREQIRDFTKVRLRLAQMKQQLGEKTFPKSRSINWWKEFCFGNKNNSDNSSSESESICESEQTNADTPQSNSSSLNTNDKTSSSSSRGQLPLLSIVCEMSQDEVIHVLDYNVKWIRQFGFSNKNGIWIYALLANLEKPLISEVYSTLRELSRVCSEVRSKIESQDQTKTLIPLNLIICLIGRYFNQCDMVDE